MIESYSAGHGILLISFMLCLSLPFLGQSIIYYDVVLLLINYKGKSAEIVGCRNKEQLKNANDNDII